MSNLQPTPATSPEKIDDILVYNEESKLFGVKSGQASSGAVDDATLAKQVDGLIAVVEEKIERSSSYRQKNPARNLKAHAQLPCHAFMVSAG